MKSLHLTYANNKPIFVSGGASGQQVNLRFGLGWLDDFDFPIVIYELLLCKPDQSEWHLILYQIQDKRSMLDRLQVTEKDAEAYFSLKSQILAFTNKVNLAIHERRDFDCSNMIMSFQNLDEYFDFFVFP
jgi:hypothetical protein